MPERPDTMNTNIDAQTADTLSEKADGAFRTISEVADDLGVQQHVLRFWETKFSQVRPLKRGGGRRYYRPEDVVLLKKIHHLLYAQGYTIRGVQKLFKGMTRGQIIQSLDLAPAVALPAGTGSSAAASPSVRAAQAQAAALGLGPPVLQPEQRAALEHALRELEDMRRMLKSVA